MSLIKKISVCIISKNEEDRLPKVIEAIHDIFNNKLVYEIIIIDSGSSDKTVEISKNMGCRVFEENWKGYSEQRNSAAKKSEAEWLLFLDSDEVPDENLKENILKILTNSNYQAFYVKRKTYYLGKILDHSWQPDRVLRLIKRDAFKSWSGNIHENILFDGNTGILDGYLIHYSYRNLLEHINKSIEYARLWADDKFKNNKKFKIYNLIINPVVAFIRLYFIGGSFRDGLRGFIAASSSLFYTFIKYLFLWELDYKSKNKDEIN